MKITDKDQAKILELIKKSHDPRVIYRANALNLRGKGYTLIEVGDILEITSRTVFNIEKNYEDGGLQKALFDDPRPGAPVQFDDGTRLQIIALVCSDPPEGFDRWTLELIKEHSVKQNIVSEISKETIRVILEESDLQPWRQKMWCVPELTEEYINRMEDLLDLYEKKYNKNYPVVCLDEKPIQMIEDTRPVSGVLPGEVKKIDFEYKRNGIANVFCAVEPKVGKYLLKVTERKTGNDFAKIIAKIGKEYESARKIILVMDNFGTHKEKSVLEYFGEAEGKKLWKKFEIHYTPKHASWLNQAEIAIGMYSRQCLGKSRIPDLDTLKKKTLSWCKVLNRIKVKINWSFTKEKAKKTFSYR